jgi:hypothetical protein
MRFDDVGAPEPEGRHMILVWTVGPPETLASEDAHAYELPELGPGQTLAFALSLCGVATEDDAPRWTAHDHAGRVPLCDACRRAVVLPSRARSRPRATDARGRRRLDRVR